MYKITFNGVAMPDFMKVKAVDFPASADIATNIIQKTGGNGGIFAGSKRGSKKIKVKIQLVPQTSFDTMPSMARLLGEWIMGNQWGLSELNFSDDSTMFYDAVVDGGVDIADMIFTGVGDITFIVPSGVGRGLIINKDAVIDLAGKKATVVYGGSAPSSAYIKYLPFVTVVPTDNWLMTVTETGDRLRLNNVSSTNTTTIDCERRNISNSQVSCIKDVVLLQTEWITFPKRGTYHLTWNFSSECELQIQYTEYFI